jgi:hypothetical protein
MKYLGSGHGLQAAGNPGLAGAGAAIEHDDLGRHAIGSLLVYARCGFGSVVHGPGWRPPTSMLLSYLGFPCYVIAAGLAFWRPAVNLIVCGALWIVWTIKAPMLTADQEPDESGA